VFEFDFLKHRTVFIVAAIAVESPDPSVCNFLCEVSGGLAAESADRWSNNEPFGLLLNYLFVELGGCAGAT
jgi:hypothetical protein